MIKKIFKVLLYILIFGALAVLIFWLTRTKGWPLWVGAAIFGGIVGLWVAFLFFRKFFFRKREKAFVKRVIQEDEAAIGRAPIHERQQLQDLQSHWKECVERLQASHLRRRGNPLYVLPWFLILGETGSGKTTAIRSSRLSTPLTEIGATPGVSGTRNCDWWFFDQAVILDAAGRYAIPLEEVPDREEWEKFLTLLARYRKKEPLNGLIVTVPADKLLQGSEEVLRKDGQMLRKRLDHLMRILGAKFPVYLMVTKIDLVEGMVPFCGQLSEDACRQAMGCINQEETPYWHEFLESALAEVGGRLKELRFVLAHGEKRPAPEALLFPSAFLRLRPGLTAFARGLFEENPYQESPFFRGLFFSSGRQESEPPSELLKLLQVKADSPSSPRVQSQGYFLQEFFSALLPRDRSLFSPLLEFMRWKRLTRNLGFLSWTLVFLALCGLLTLAFLENIHSYKGFVYPNFFRPPALTKEMGTNLIMFDTFRQELQDLKKDNESWLVRNLGLRESLDLEDKLSRHYLKSFHEGILVPFDLALRKGAQEVTRETPGEVIAAHVGHAVLRIMVLRMAMEGKFDSRAVKLLGEVSGILLCQMDRSLSPEVAWKFGDLYHSYLLWGGNKIEEETQVKELQMTVEKIFFLRGYGLHWMIHPWMAQTSKVRLADFWGGTREETEDEPAVHGAYTREGRKHLEDFMEALEKTLRDPQEFRKHKEEFWRWYEENYLRSWADFGRRFSEGEGRLEGETEWQATAAGMASKSNPYFKLLERMAAELAPLAGSRKAPPWAGRVIEFKKLRGLAAKAAQEEKGSLLGTIAQKGASLMAAAAKPIDPKAAAQAEKEIGLSKLLLAYEQALEANAPLGVSRDAALKAAGDLFTEGQDPADGKGPSLRAARRQFLKLKSGVEEKEGPDARLFWNLVYGPLDFMLFYSVQVTAAALQSAWEEKVLGGLQGAGKEKIPNLLFDQPDGLIWKYLQGPAAPFIGRNKNGFFGRRALGHGVPFRREFFDFLNRGAENTMAAKSSFEVGIEALPLKVNPGAKVKPMGSVLELQCASGKTVLENFNYPASQVFRWDPQTCGAAGLKILLPEFSLVKKYDGPLGFAQFIAEFRSGSRTFEAASFPDRAEFLKKTGIQWIKLTYRISGSKPLIEMAQRVPAVIPDEIILPTQDERRTSGSDEWRRKSEG